MMKFLIVALALAVAVAAHPAHIGEDEYTSMFAEFKDTHSKSYESETEEALRFAIFKSNVDKINAHNAEYAMGKHTFTMAVNQFADLTQHEFESTYLTLNTQRPSGRVHVFNGNAVDLPSSVNWVTKGAVTNVKNQGQCGSCWAFSTCASIEGLMAISGHGLHSLAPQELVDCDSGSDGCNGGLMDQAFQWVIQNGGLCSWDDYPYTAQDGTCQKSQCKSIATISGYKDVSQDTHSLMSAVAQQPVSIAVDASQWSFYSGGIYSQSCGTQLDHGVLAAGYGTSNGQDYWLVKNSWGTSWGESGYIRVARGNNECGILNAASYPTN